MKAILKKVRAVSIIGLCFIFMSCSKNIDDEIDKYIPINLSKGSVVFNNTSGRFIYNLVDGIYKSVDDKRDIIEFNKNDTILFSNDNNGIVQYKGKQITLNEKQIIKENISPSGKYLMYFTQDEALKLKVFNLETEKYEEIELNGSISGDLVDWYDDSKIVFYGVNEKKDNGIFVYDINTKIQKEIYKIQEGYINYLENIKSGLVIKEEKFNGESSVKIIKKDNTVEALSHEVDEIIDVEGTSKGIYLLGSKIDDNISVYEHLDGDFERVVFNFPSYIHIESKLASSEEGDILFVGSNSNPKEHSIYKYSDGSISTMSANKGEYRFIRIR